MTTRAADDANFIFGRIAELRKEAKDRLNADCDCDCPDDVREDGTIIKAHRTGCPHYVATSLPAGFVRLLPQQARRMPDIDWRVLQEQALSVEAAFLRRRLAHIDAAAAKYALLGRKL